MTEMEKYIKSVRRHLNLPKDVKNRVMSDFVSSIHARQEAGQKEEEILAELGDAKKAAADLNEQMKEFAYRKSPWRFLFLALAIGCGIWLIGQAAMAAVLHSVANGSASVGIIGGADGPTAIFVTSRPSIAAGLRLAGSILLLLGGVAGYWLLGHRTDRHPEK